METIRSSHSALAGREEDFHPSPWLGTRTAKPGDYKWIQQLASIVCSQESTLGGPRWCVAQTASILIGTQARYDTIELIQSCKSDDELALVFGADLDLDSGCQRIGQLLFQPRDVA